MKRSLLKKRNLIFIILFFFTVFLTNFSLTKKAEAQVELSEDVAIAAIVETWIYFVISPLAVDIEPALIGIDGTLNIGTSPDIVFSVGTNNVGGWYIEMKGKNSGLKSLSTNAVIDSVNSTSTLVAGTDGYGANATGTLTGVSIGELYDYYGTDTVGEIVDSYNLLALKESENLLTDVVKVQIKAAASIMTPAAIDYSDVIIITLTPII